MLTDAQHVECRDGPVEPLEPELADRLHLDVVLDLRVQALLMRIWPAVASSASREARFVTAPTAA